MATLNQVRPTRVLTLNDLADIEDKFGGLDKVDLTKFTVLRYILWLVLRKDDNKMDERAVGDKFSLDTMRDEIDKVLRSSGLIGNDEGGVSEGKAPGA
jgi:hypothetical protein